MLKIRKKAISLKVAILLLTLLFFLGCQPQPTPEVAPTPAPATKQVQESDIPANFTTYTEEGLFSVSYPSDWRPAKSMIDYIMEESEKEITAVDPTASLEGMGMIFFGGKECPEGYYPNVNIMTDKRFIGYFTLDEVYEANDLWCEENLPGYEVLSVNRTAVDGRDAIIDEYEDNDPQWGRWRYICMCTVEGDFAWLVTCGCEYQDFNKYKGVFESVVRSLRILQ